MHARLDLLGCPLDPVDLAGATDRVVTLVRAAPRTPGSTRWAVPVNASKWVRMRHDPTLRGLTRRAALVVADGASIVRTARRLGHAVPGRVTGVGLMEALLAEAQARRWRTFLLGARPDVVAEAARRVGAAGHHHGYFTDERAVLDRIASVDPDLLFLALGTPLQEHTLARWLPSLSVPFAMGVGGGFDVLAGTVRRAPASVGDAGLEWAWRLALQPRSRWRRAVVDSARYVALTRAGRRLPEP